MDHPEAFGQHANADIASQITETRTLLETLLSLQPQVSASASGQTVEEKVLQLAGDVLSKIPEPLDYDGTAKILKDDPSPINVVLLQEVSLSNFHQFSNQVIFQTTSSSLITWLRIWYDSLLWGVYRGI